MRAADGAEGRARRARVASRCPFGPSRSGERFTADDGAEALEKDLGESGFDGRQRSPQTLEPQHAVLVECRQRRSRTAGSERKGVEPSTHVEFLSRYAHPVLERVLDEGGADPSSTSNNLGTPSALETGAALGLVRPANQDDLHRRHRRDGTFPDCFVRVKGP